MKQIWKDIKDRWPLVLATALFVIGAILVNW